MGPGCTLLTVMPRAPSSRAGPCVNGLAVQSASGATEKGVRLVSALAMKSYWIRSARPLTTTELLHIHLI